MTKKKAAMATPTVSASLDKSTYAPGDKMTLTVSYGDADNAAGTVTVTVTDAEGNASTPVTAAYSVADPVTLAVSDPSHTFKKVSDAAGVAVFTATA